MEACDVCFDIDGGSHVVVEAAFEVKIKRLKGGHTTTIHLCRHHAISVQVDQLNTLAGISDSCFQDDMERADREMGDPNP